MLLARTGSHHKMQVVRLKTTEGMKIVGKLIIIFVFSHIMDFTLYNCIMRHIIGTLIPKSCVEALKQDLGADAEKTEEKVSDL